MKEATLDQVYTYMQDFLQDHGYAPLFAEVARGCGLSNSTVEEAASILQERGKIDWTPRVFRSLRLVEPGGEGVQANGNAIR